MFSHFKQFKICTLQGKCNGVPLYLTNMADLNAVWRLKVSLLADWAERTQT